jgi:predicted phosphodiesterase
LFCSIVHQFRPNLIIHTVFFGIQQPVTKYYYQCGSASAGISGVFSFTTTPAPGPNVPVVLGLLGDLGQTPDSATTVQHIMSDQSIQMTFLVGDLSYADAENKASKSRPCSQDRWDAWGQVMQPMMSSQAVLPLPGNHEPEDVTKVYPQYPRFLAFQSRFRTPSLDSGVAASDHNLYYTFRVGAAQVIALSSYSPFDSSSAQYQWLQNTLAKVDRTVTPWLIVGFHAPWYNSNTAHQGEPQSTDMRQDIEPLLLQAGVDVAFAGHVHAYERILPSASAPQNGITYINIGDGGNREGPADNWITPAPVWSAYREAKFGHGRLHVYNHTHMHWTWQKNEDSLPVAGDQVWLIRPAGRSPLQSGFGGGIEAVPGKRE